MKDIKVVISQDVFRRMPTLPVHIGKKFPEWLIRFQAEPDSPGLNYETIKSARDKHLRSVRIDQDWRAIVFKPDKGDVYVLLHIDKHDDAYAWAERRVVTINPVLGSIQVINTTHVEEAIARQPAAGPSAPPAAFAEISDAELVSLGVPEAMMPVVRLIRTESDLDGQREYLPLEAYEGLFLLLAGDTVNSILSSRETKVDAKIDVEDYGAAVDRDASRSRFYVVEGEDALRAVLEAPHEQWRFFLHPTQRLLSTKRLSGPARVLGGAGTGKTVLAIHRAKQLADGLSASGGKVLFTTFTTNLAIDIEDALQGLAGGALPKNLEVKNLDAWVFAFLRARRYEHEIMFDFEKKGEPVWERAMAEAFDPSIGVDRGFVRDEFEQVVLAQGLQTLDAYREAPRRGRGGVLSRKKRDLLWKVFEEYRVLLSGKKLKEPDDAYGDAAQLIEQDVAAGKQRPYASIVVDETQDFGPMALRLIRALVDRKENDLFFVGDGHQRIYDKNRAAMSQCGIDIRGRSRKLYLNYRTTEEIRRQAVALLEGVDVDDLDGDHDEIKRYKSLMRGPAPTVLQGLGFEAAMKAIDRFVSETLTENPNATIGLMAPTTRVRDQIAAHVRGTGQKVATVEHRERLSRRDAQIFAMTLHRAKGLEFDGVAVVSDREMDDRYRRLVYVGLTRAKRFAALLQLV